MTNSSPILATQLLLRRFCTISSLRRPESPYAMLNEMAQTDDVQKTGENPKVRVTHYRLQRTPVHHSLSV